MSDEQINIAIAKACGWEEKSFGPSWYQSYTKMPNYCNDLNAMREAEKLISEKDKESSYWFFMRELLDFPDEESDWNGFYFFAAIHATPLQKAEAFLKAIGKWEDAK